MELEQDLVAFVQFGDGLPQQTSFLVELQHQGGIGAFAVFHHFHDGGFITIGKSLEGLIQREDIDTTQIGNQIIDLPGA